MQFNLEINNLLLTLHQQKQTDMTTQINHIKQTEYSLPYLEAVITDMPAMTCAELDQLMIDLNVDVLVF